MQKGPSPMDNPLIAERLRKLIHERQMKELPLRNQLGVLDSDLQTIADNSAKVTEKILWVRDEFDSAVADLYGRRADPTVIAGGRTELYHAAVRQDKCGKAP